MLRPENTHPGDQDVVLRDSDNMETALPSGLPETSDSPSTQADAGLMEIPDIDARDFAADDTIEEPREITMTDHMAGIEGGTLHSAEMDDLSAPGEIDIEELDEDALSDTDIPREALLDPLEP
ncbi:hypothetical protein B1R32_104106 [Abditibacterium utsteinense]|uniref:Uncharacterized protein n=1 Tax=Abditibacterium utsteinense TaxID=1960156 RepID=A0A2S8SUZ5_9BACT|nr:hypothetical protein [Abditibacterium utsteinense]PQV64613.1 hypothetical protein B1R32_104106 [Abditibacterium utsteinense]